MLREKYGAVETNYRFEISTAPCPGALEEIYRALQGARGYTDFVRHPTLPPVDFWLPERNVIVEFDERQHFTPLRALALARYPVALALGFDRKFWLRRCNEIRASDKSPIYRDEQRAWYDTLRDFLPELLGLRPTIRLYGGFPWCGTAPGTTKKPRARKQLICWCPREDSNLHALAGTRP